jgi:succinylglutamate desuccinylase
MQNKRYVDVDLNRVFKKHDFPTLYEHKLANELTTIIDENDVLLDLHSTHSDDEPFVFLDFNDEKNRFLAEAC